MESTLGNRPKITSRRPHDSRMTAGRAYVGAGARAPCVVVGPWACMVGGQGRRFARLQKYPLWCRRDDCSDGNTDVYKMRIRTRFAYWNGYGSRGDAHVGACSDIYFALIWTSIRTRRGATRTDAIWARSRIPLSCANGYLSR